MRQRSQTCMAMSTNYGNSHKEYKHDLLGLGMAVGLAIPSYVIFICLGSLARILNITRKLGGNGDEPHRLQHQQ
jgi:hypothetical protein